MLDYYFISVRFLNEPTRTLQEVSKKRGGLIFRATYRILFRMRRITFLFGRNWQNFMRTRNEDRFKNAEQSLSGFLNIGCGSGLFSYAAYNFGAREIVSFDADPFSVECCRHLHGKADKPGNWKILKGSILDGDFILGLGKFDVVYTLSSECPVTLRCHSGFVASVTCCGELHS